MPELEFLQPPTFREDVSFDCGPDTMIIPGLSARAQTIFTRGIQQMFNFNHEESVRCFEKVVELHPDCAAAHWFAGHCLGPNYNNSGEDGEPDDWNRAGAHNSKALELLQNSSTPSCPTVEALIQAGRDRFPVPRPEDKQLCQQLRVQFAANMEERINPAFMDNVNMVTLYVESLMNLRPWKLWKTTGDPEPGTEKVVTLLRDALSKWPNHIGLCHFYIHAMEMSKQLREPLLLRVCKQLPTIAPDAGHLVHMPSHIWVQIGMYKESVDINLKAIEADDRIVAALGHDTFYTLYRVHNQHFVMFAAMFGGMYERTLAAGLKIKEMIPEALLRVNCMDMWLESFVSLYLHAYIRFGKWWELLEVEVPTDRQLYCTTTAMVYYGHAIAHAVLGQVDEARQDLAHLVEARDRVPENHVLFNNRCLDILDIAVEMARGEIEYRAGNYDAAFAHLRQSVFLDDHLHYEEPWGWMQPARHALGALLLEQRRVEEAEAVYREDLEKHPENVWSLHGLMDCLQQKTGHNQHEIAALAETLQRTQLNTDVPVQASCFCALQTIAKHGGLTTSATAAAT